MIFSKNRFPLFGIMLYVESTTPIPIMAAILSPCEKICIVDPASGLCRGCARNLSEIERWASYSEEERARVISELPGRLEAMRAPRPAQARPAQARPAQAKP
jgi:predicted Fe-S protein YdhL (DUF1289 family)